MRPYTTKRAYMKPSPPIAMVTFCFLLNCLPTNANPDQVKVTFDNHSGLIGKPFIPKAQPLEMQYLQELNELVLRSTPKEEAYTGPDGKMPETFTSVSFDVNDAGLISNIKLSRASNSVARNFWTLYAVSSCPPFKPTNEVTLPVHATVDNFLVKGPGGDEDLKDRMALEKSLLLKGDSAHVHFCVIPASFRKVFAGYFTIDEICEKQNVVGLSNKLAEEGPKNPVISGLFAEWSNFFKRNSKPSKASIIAFRDDLKEKYKKIFVE
ncbi:MAG: hypothetical protein KGS72_28195 [Cyanobacteria bacterium REEB67]|nr:hypothetical protein [Cyanobacteria bacterium REEB67]